VSPTGDLEWEALTAEVRDLLRELRPIEADILRQRFGLGTEQELTLKEIGDKYNLSRERIASSRSRPSPRCVVRWLARPDLEIAGRHLTWVRLSDAQSFAVSHRPSAAGGVRVAVRAGASACGGDTPSSW